MSVPVAVDCPHCSARNDVPSELAGLPVTCAKCGDRERGGRMTGKAGTGRPRDAGGGGE